MRFIPLALCIAVAACGYRHPPDKPLEKMAERCEDFGYVRGSSGYGTCLQKLSAKSEAEKDRRLARELAR